MLTSWIARPARITGRRPNASDSEPVNNNVMRRAIA